MNASTITQIVNHLTEAKAYAAIAGLDHHFNSEIDHLIATAKANIECHGESHNKRKQKKGKNEHQ